MARIVAQTELLSIVPSHYGLLLQEQGTIRSLPVPHPLPDHDIKQHWHRRFHHDPGNIWLRRVVADLWMRVTLSVALVMDNQTVVLCCDLDMT